MDNRIKKCKDCNKKISSGSKFGRCQSCSSKGKRNPFYGKRHTKKTKNKLSKSHKGIFEDKNNPNYIDGRTLKKYYCKDCGTKIGINSGYYGQGRCNSCANKGERSSNWKNGKSFKSYFCKICGEKISRKGALYKKGRCQCCAQKERFKDPKKHYNYIDGRGYDPYSPEFNKTLKTKIRKRDNYTCQQCKMIEKEHVIIYGNFLEVHHIDYNKENCKKNNLIALCKRCNIKANKNRDYWFAYFTYIMEIIYE